VVHRGVARDLRGRRVRQRAERRSDLGRRVRGMRVLKSCREPDLALDAPCRAERAFESLLQPCRLSPHPAGLANFGLAKLRPGGRAEQMRTGNSGADAGSVCESRQVVGL